MSTNLNSIAARAILFMFIVGGPVWAEQIAIIPDTQGYTANAANHEILLEQTRWIAENSEAAELALITHVGDIISYRGSLNQDEQWRFADENYDQFDGSVPYSVAYGNHDFDFGVDQLVKMARPILKALLKRLLRSPDHSFLPETETISFCP